MNLVKTFIYDEKGATDCSLYLGRDHCSRTEHWYESQCYVYERCGGPQDEVSLATNV